MSHTDLIIFGKRVRIVYRDGAGEVTERVVDIERVYRSAKGDTLIVGFCHRRGQNRTFNAANILAAMPDDSTTIATFAMSAAVTANDAEAFSAAYQALHAA